MKRIKLIIIGLIGLFSSSFSAICIDGVESSQWMVDYSNGEKVDINANSYDELLAYIKDNSNQSFSYSNDDEGCTLDIEIGRAFFYNYVYHPYSPMIASNGFYWNVGASIQASEWENNYGPYFDPVYDSPTLPCKSTVFVILEDRSIEDVDVKIEEIETVELPYVNLMPYYMDQFDGMDSPEPSVGINDRSAISPMGETDHYLPEEMILKMPIKSQLVKECELLIYLGQYSENPNKLMGIKKIKVRVNGAHYKANDSGVIDPVMDLNSSIKYDLMGREIRDLQPGTIYIRCGKKYVAK